MVVNVGTTCDEWFLCLVRHYYWHGFNVRESLVVMVVPAFQ